ncbi:hypothetical protein R20943_07049 [Paraburkholderia aspalathi]|nr:hypothetical protein R20943_07049 [Paraburkholderia aspalathi]
MANGDAVVGHHNLLDEQSRDALTVLNVEGLGMAAQTLQECRQRFRQPQIGGLVDQLGAERAKLVLQTLLTLSHRRHAPP